MIGIAFILATALVHGIDDIQVGNCYTFPEVQGVLETERSDIYQGGDCNKDYGVDGIVKQKLACGTEFDTGEWHRKMVKHKEPGFFPWGAPCMESVEFSSYESTTYSEVKETLACTKENSTVLKYQQEKMSTKKFSIASGEAYLPNPLWVHREKFGLNDSNEYVRISCRESELNSAYEGWGKFHAEWVERECGTNGKVVVCKDAKLVASQNDKGQTCMLVEKLDDCLP